MNLELKLLALCVMFVVSCHALKVSAAASGGEDAVQLGTEAVLLLDNTTIRDMRNVERVVHQGVKDDEPALEPTYPWEGDRLYTMGTVHYDEREQQFRLWYMARDMIGNRFQDYILYATSKDGMNWERPNLGIHEYQGSTDNNIVLDHVHSPSVVVEKDGDDGYQYRMIATRYHPRGYHVATSEDGVNWSDFQPALAGSDNVTMIQDPQTGEYMAFHRLMVKVGRFERRSVFLSTSSDFKTWSEPQLVIAPDTRDDEAWVTDATKERTEFYNMTAAPYESQYVGFVTVCHFQPTPRVTTANQSSTDGPIYVELTYSHEGRDWHRLESREPILEPGPAQWDQGMILALSNPIVHNDEVWIYYTGFNVEHGGPRPPKRSVIGRASWRLDGFVSLRSQDNETGVIETVLIQPEHERMFINVIANQGNVTVELIDADGEVIPGYSRADCIAVRGDDVRAAVRWRGHDTVPTHQPFRIRFHLEAAQMFSFRFVKP